MPDSPLLPPQRVPVRDAFAALPLEEPPRPVWPTLATRLQRTPRRRHSALWWAVAASAVLAAVLVPRLAPPDATPGFGPPTASGPLVAQADAGVEALVQQSQALESRIQRMPPALRSASAVLAGEWIAADIGVIDAALAEAPPEDAGALWQTRVVLLAELAGLQHNESLTASGAGGFELALD